MVCRINKFLPVWISAKMWLVEKNMNYASLRKKKNNQITLWNVKFTICFCTPNVIKSP